MHIAGFPAIFFNRIAQVHQSIFPFCREINCPANADSIVPHFYAETYHEKTYAIPEMIEVDTVVDKVMAGSVMSCTKD